MKALVFWIVIFVVVVLLWQSLQSGASRATEISFNRFTALVEAGSVDRVTIRDRRIFGTLKDPSDGLLDFRLILPFEPDAEFVGGLVEAGVTVKGRQVREDRLLTIFLTWGPMLVIVGLWIFFMRIFQKQGNRRLSEARSTDEDGRDSNGFDDRFG